MREAEPRIDFFDNEEDEEFSVDIVSPEGDTGRAELAVGRTRKAAITKAKKALQKLLQELDDGSGSSTNQD